ncbi:MAG: LysM peptidoglycan-binding domain-containing protein [Litorilinea sp.]
MNQMLLSALRMRRLLFVALGIMIATWAMFPAAAYAAGGDRGSAEFVYEHHDNYRGKGHHNDHGEYRDHKPAHHACANTYTVRKGDTLSKLARHYGTTVHALARANGIHNPNRIYVGQRLCVPKGHVYVPPAPRCKAYHTVAHGDTLVSIARRHHTSVDSIIDENKLRGPHYIYKGQQLCIR